MFRRFHLAVLLVLLSPMFLISQAGAVDFDIVGGGSFTSGTRWTPVVFADVGFNTEKQGMHVEPVATVGWIRHRSTSYGHLDHNVYIGGGGARLANIWGGGFASFQFGLTAGSHTDALSSTEQFISTIGWRQSHYTFMVRHISNGGFFKGRNLGETMLMVGVNF